MARTKKSNSVKIYQLKVTLSESDPAIWRCIQVPGNTKLPDLHLMLQAAMGWVNGHLHLFTIHHVNYIIPDPDFGMGEEDEDEASVRLDKVIPRANTHFRYLYDFGDGWEHDIIVEEILPPEPDTQYPLCLAGARACPPEDCGGVWGYSDFLEAINDPAHEEHESVLEWIGGSFDPEEFDLEGVNECIKEYKLLDFGY